MARCGIDLPHAEHWVGATDGPELCSGVPKGNGRGAVSPDELGPNVFRTHLPPYSDPAEYEPDNPVAEADGLSEAVAGLAAEDAAIRSRARGLHQIYEALTAEGFTEGQALRIIGQMLLVEAVQ